MVSKSEAIARLESSATKMARALDTLTAERGGRMGITHLIVGTITLSISLATGRRRTSFGTTARRSG
jgi:hypothetical protein